MRPHAAASAVVLNIRKRSGAGRGLPCLATPPCSHTSPRFASPRASHRSSHRSAAVAVAHARAPTSRLAHRRFPARAGGCRACVVVRHKKTADALATRAPLEDDRACPRFALPVRTRMNAHARVSELIGGSTTDSSSRARPTERIVLGRVRLTGWRATSRARADGLGARACGRHLSECRARVRTRTSCRVRTACAARTPRLSTLDVGRRALPPSELRASACSFDAQAFGMPPFARCVRTRSHLPAGASAQSCLLALVSGRPSDRQSDGVPGELGARATSFDAHAGEQHLGGLRAHLHSLATRLTAYANGQPVCAHGAGCPARAHQQATPESWPCRATQ